jgi:hydrogenase-4 component B
MVLGMAGALLHVLNHALFKALLFLSAGAAIHGAGTRDIDRMGGLARRMPLTSLMFCLGAVAICGLPPLNGFVSECLIYLGLFRGIQSSPGIAPPVMGLAAPLLALIGGLAVACFVKVYGIAFLGLPRQQQCEAREPAASMLAAMVPLAAACVVIGTMPSLIARPLDAVIAALLPAGSPPLPLAAFAPLGAIGQGAGLLLVLVLLLAAWYRRRLAGHPRGEAPTWGCGYLAPTPRMQYTASSFAATLVQLFAPLLRPRGGAPKITGVFPARSSYHSHVPETMLELVFIPLLERLYARIAPLRRLQSGLLQHYMLYIFITLLVLLAWGRL